jgi:hypothetical protein
MAADWLEQCVVMRLAFAALALATTAAAPAPRPLPLPPVPPDRPPTEQVAPTPDRNARAPFVPAETGVRVLPQDFRVGRFNQGLGYAPGSQYPTSEDKRPIQTPGLSVQVPLQ